MLGDERGSLLFELLDRVEAWPLEDLREDGREELAVRRCDREVRQLEHRLRERLRAPEPCIGLRIGLAAKEGPVREPHRHAPRAEERREARLHRALGPAVGRTREAVEDSLAGPLRLRAALEREDDLLQEGLVGEKLTARVKEPQSREGFGKRL